jgi:hypothetical protein
MPRKICLHVDKQEILKNDYFWTKNNEKNIVFMYERAPGFPLRVFSGSLLLIVFGILFCGSSFSVLCTQCCRLITLRFSLTFIYKSKLSSFAPIFGWWRQITSEIDDIFHGKTYLCTIYAVSSSQLNCI